MEESSQVKSEDRSPAHSPNNCPTNTFERGALFAALPDIYLRLADDSTVLDVQLPEPDAFVLPATGLLGRRLVDCWPSHLTDPLQQALQQARQHCASTSLNYCLPTPRGDRYFESRFVPLGAHQFISITRDMTEQRAVERERQERTALLEFRLEIDRCLTIEQPIAPMLQQCAQVMVDSLQAAFARIWLLNDAEQMLELQASAGLYTHSDGPHGRVPVGAFKIGRIAASGHPHLSNDVLNDPNVGDRDWAAREGMVAFAGYPILLDRQVIGVAAMFARQPLSSLVLDELQLVTREIAFGITRQQNRLALEASEQALRHKAEALQTTLDRLQLAQKQLVQSEKMSSLGQLVAGVAHEINNPVNFIAGNLTHLRSAVTDLLELVAAYQAHYPQPHPELADLTETIELEFLRDDLPALFQSMRLGVDRIKDIVQSLRTFSRLDESNCQMVNLHEVIDSALLILSHRLKGCRPSIAVTRTYGDLPLVACYPGPLTQVFMNILSNAIDAIQEMDWTDRPTKPAIDLSTALKADRVLITISDNGPGMDEATQARIFDPFFTTKGLNRGTGLGMSISREIVVDKHCGRLNCQSRVGAGTVFGLDLPIELAAPSSSEQAIARQSSPVKETD
ncbi:MAG: GAF domain-containing protein [Oscillatoriales cyanobacterium]|nr:MAG: GAF domain-containing protein [Oscillatoriales cyanobacterium]